MFSRVDYFSNDLIKDNLKVKAVRGGMATGVAQLLDIVIGLATVPIFARLLDPGDFGLVAMAAVFTSFAAMFVDSGLSMATVQQQKISPVQVSNLFWIATALGMAIAALLIAASPLIGWLYDDSRLTLIVMALAIALVFSGLTIQHQALLHRGMRFHRLAGVRVFSALVGQGTGVAWALTFKGAPEDYWALVLIPLATAFTRMTLTWIACGWLPSLPKRGQGTRAMVEFGANITGFNFINYLARNVDYLLIGWWWGDQALGYYERAYRLLLTPARRASPAITTVVVPALSRLKSSPDQYRIAWRAAVRPLSWGISFLVGMLASTAEPLILVYLGQKWTQVAPLFQALSPAAWATSIGICFGWVFYSWGHVNKLLLWGIANSIAVISVIAVCLPFGTLTVAYGVSVVYVLMRIPGAWICFSGTPLSTRDLVELFWRPTCVVVVASAATTLVGQQFMAGQPPLYSLVITACAFVTSFAVAVLVIPGSLAELRKLKDITRLLKKKGAG